MSKEYEVGDVARTTFVFVGLDGSPVDPASITAVVTLPDRSVANYSTAAGTVVNDPAAVGSFYLDHEITQVGVHKVKALAVSPKSAVTARFTSVG